MKLKTLKTWSLAGEGEGVCHRTSVNLYRLPTESACGGSGLSRLPRALNIGSSIALATLSLFRQADKGDASYACLLMAYRLTNTLALRLLTWREELNVYQVPTDGTSFTPQRLLSTS